MNNTISEIKERAKCYQDLILKKEEIFKEFQSWNDLYKEAQSILEQAEETYEREQTEEAKIEYENWINECKDYLTIVSEYSLKFEEINQELNTYDVDTMNEQVEYLSTLTKFQLISDKMKEIEKRSKKIAGGATIGTGYVVVKNAEGRNKNINETFAADYAKLAEEKRALAKVLRKQYNSVINKVEMAEKEELEDPQVKIDPISTPETKNEYDTMTIEDKIKKLEEKMEFYKNASGRKQRVKYCGEVITLPRCYIGSYLICAGELKKLQKGLNNSEQKPNIFYEALDYVKKEKNFEDVQFDRENEELFAMVNRHHDEYAAKQKEEEKNKLNKSKNFMKILNIRKPKNLERLKEKIKSAAALIAAGAIVLAYASPIFVQIFGNNKTTENPNNVPDNDIISELTIDEQEELDKVTDNIIVEDSSTIATQVEDEFIKLGDKFNVKNNSKIYNTMYDATLARDGLRPYFSTEYEREVGGLAINYEGELYFFYSTDANAQENVDMLIANGGKITSVLSQIASGYEGFYNIEDVNSLNNTLGGMNR